MKSSPLSKHHIENLTIVLYVVLLTFVSIHHEPWFDEAQAWLIARDSGLWEMLWEVLRYEGHPPLWHLLLYLPAHAGLPFEVSIKTLNILISACSTALIVKKSPFPFAVRVVLPFSYFFFYQYGVINRPYALLGLALWLTALAFPKRNEKPYRFILPLALLSSITAHGMLIAFGTALAWSFETYQSRERQSGKGVSKELFRDRRFQGLVWLGLLNLFYVAMLWPMPDKTTPFQYDDFSLPRLLFNFFAMPMNAIFSDYFPSSHYMGMQSILLMIAGALLLTALFYFAHQKGLLSYAAIPYCLTGLFISSVYLQRHHVGIYMLIMIYIGWISLNEGQKYPFTNILHDLCQLGRNSNIVTSSLLLIPIVLVAVQIYWTGSAAINEYQYAYDSSRDIANYLKQHQLDEKRIFTGYGTFDGRNEPWLCNVTVLAYFDRNILMNNNLPYPLRSYSMHKRWNLEETNLLLSQMGPPQVVIQYAHSLHYYKEHLNAKDYVPVKEFSRKSVWKSSVYSDTIVIFALIEPISQTKE